MALNKLGMYTEVELRKDEEDTAVESASPRDLVIPLTTLRKHNIKLPSVWTSLRFWAAVKLAELSAWMAP